MRRELWLEIKRLKAEGLSSRGIAAELGMDRRTVARALLAEAPPRRKAVAGRPSVIEGRRGWILGRLEAHPRLSASRIFGMLTEMGYAGKYGAVKEFVRSVKPSARPAVMTLRFAPGEMAQADWAHAGTVRVDGAARRLSLFVMTLCHSRRMFADFFLGEAMEHWLEAHWAAFCFFGGVPSGVMVDNCRVAVLAREPGGEARLNPRYEDFASVCGFKPHACAPRRPQEKGRVERAVGYIRTGFLEGRGAESFEGMRASLADWLSSTANRRVHGTTGRVPDELFEEEDRKALRPLPPIPPDRSARDCVQASAQYRVIVDSNRYSVPPGLAGARLDLRKTHDRIDLYGEDGLAASHARRYGRRLDIVDPSHDRAHMDRCRSARERMAVDAFLRLGGAAEPYLVQLRERRPDWLSHVRRIAALAEAHGRDEAARALRDAAESGAYSAEYVLNILDARARPLHEAGPLRLLRGEDMLRIDLPPPDIAIYGQDGSPRSGFHGFGPPPRVNPVEAAGPHGDDAIQRKGG